MTEIEFEIMDELYFVTSFQQLGNALLRTHEELCHSLQDLVVRGYVKCFYPDPDTEIEYNQVKFSKECQQYYFLATKAGLMVHNSR
ncbi:hypothetical protein AHMF7605_20210 [Adhaeribacter arboris]|uniref:MarR family transcriptional regulator n=1 Tax=Adhaeribacter arboris TaxID=2072846 RepID=A0A2T2YJH2_9BACT|nr:hypothetical protein [Adhaeribacter arboris]PSR55663.1 hypothetical protein AHMF7605_20210 [Adhaeribacter arboris]